MHLNQIYAFPQDVDIVAKFRGNSNLHIPYFIRKNSSCSIPSPSLMRIMKLAKSRLKVQVEKEEGPRGEGQSPQVEKDEGPVAETRSRLLIVAAGPN